MEIEFIHPKHLVFTSKEHAEVEKLENQMKEDEQLNWVLNTPIKDLLKKYPVYKHLVDSEKIILRKNATLFYAIRLACEWLSDQSYFALRNGKIEGFFVYFRKVEEVTDFRMFSLYPERFYDNQEQDLVDIVTVLKRDFSEVAGN